MNAVIYGDGFISKHLAKRLKSLEIKSVIIHHTDLYSPLPSKIDYIFYLFSYGNHSFQIQKEEIIKVNLLQLEDVLTLTKDIDYSAFIHFSTSSVLLPVQTMYSLTKSRAENLIRTFAKENKKSAFSIRPFSVYGPGEADFRFIPTVIRCILKDQPFTIDPLATHDWIYIDDFIDAIVCLLEKPEKMIHPVSIGTGVSLSNWTIFQKLMDISKIDFQNWQETGMLRTYDMHNLDWVADNSFIRSLGWRQKHSIEEGLIETFNYYKEEYGCI